VSRQALPRPAADGTRSARHQHRGRFSDEFQQFLLPYEAVRTASDPDRALTEFLQTTYEAAAERGNWDRQALEADPNRWRTEALRAGGRPGAGKER
jgi:Family of unknown function (DUF5996)